MWHGERLQEQQTGGVALECRQSEDLLASDGIANCGVKGLQFRASCGVNLDDFGRFAETEAHIDGHCLSYFNLHRRRNGLRKSRSRNRDRIESGRDLRKGILTGSICVGASQGASGVVTQLDLGLRDHGSRRVSDLPKHLSGG